MSWAVVFRIRQYLNDSLWVLPAAGGVLGVVLAALDNRLEKNFPVPDAWQYSAATASSALTSIVAATVALLGFVVTVSVLVVQLATGTLSPRFMRLWYRDRMQKIVLAAFSATFGFAYGLLRRIQEDTVPSIGVTVAGVAVGGSVLLLLLYLDRFAHGLRPVAVAAQVAAAGSAVIRAIEADRSAVEDERDEPRPPVGSPIRTVRSHRSGTIQALHHHGLVAAAVREDCLLVITRSVGDFVPRGALMVEVYGNAGAPSGHRLAAMLALGKERTIDQDPAFALRILVDIAIRALSPAVNDPTTASQVIDYIEDLVQVIGSADVRSLWQLRDSTGQVRVLVRGRAWEEYLTLAVTEIRHYGATSPQVCRRLRAMLEQLHDDVRPERRAPVAAELAALEATVERTFTDPAERAFAGGSDRQGVGGSPGLARPPWRQEPVVNR
jgi:uncharacterized membrane protein